MPPKRTSFKRPLPKYSFDQPINSKRRSVSVTFAATPDIVPANPPANTPAIPPANPPANPPMNPPVILPANPPNYPAEASTDVTLDSQATWQNLEPETDLSSWTHDREFRERNNNLRQIFEEEGVDYRKVVSEAELRNRTSAAVKLRQDSVAKMFKLLNESRNIQLCFLVDVTSSMDKHIKGVRNSILKIVEKLTVAGSDAIAKEVSLAFVGYRDFGDTDQFELLPFTKSAEDFRQFCSGIKAIGGDDAPEDVFGGLQKAICDLNWTESMCTKIIFHVADAPCHGKKYQSAKFIATYSDRYPDGDPSGRTEEDLFNLLREKGIQYHFGKITWGTDKMIELFSEAVGNEIDVFDIEDVDKLVDSVVSSVSIGTSILPTMRAKSRIKTDKTIPDWKKLPDFRGIFLSYEVPETVIEVTSGVCMTPKRPTKAKVQIAENPFAHGQERKVFYGRDLSSKSPTDIVLKEYIRKNTDTASRSSAVPYENAIQMQTIAAYLASVFGDCLTEKNLQKGTLDLCIKFLKGQVLKIEIKPGENRYLSCERRYGNDSKFLRFSNNTDYEMLECTCKLNNLSFEVVELLMAFSHWTYEITDGYLMVVDLQGIMSTDGNGRTILELTDPAIHCTDRLRFGGTNWSEEGMQRFFARHKCNKFCQGLKLKEHVVTTS